MENGQVDSYKGKALDDIDLDLEQDLLQETMNDNENDDIIPDEDLHDMLSSELNTDIGTTGKEVNLPLHDVTNANTPCIPAVVTAKKKRNLVPWTQSPARIIIKERIFQIDDGEQGSVAPINEEWTLHRPMRRTGTALAALAANHVLFLAKIDSTASTSPAAEHVVILAQAAARSAAARPAIGRAPTAARVAASAVARWCCRKSRAASLAAKSCRRRERGGRQQSRGRGISRLLRLAQYRAETGSLYAINWTRSADSCASRSFGCTAPWCCRKSRAASSAAKTCRQRERGGRQQSRGPGARHISLRESQLRLYRVLVLPEEPRRQLSREEVQAARARWAAAVAGARLMAFTAARAIPRRNREPIRN
ncbi:hypothetical protein MSG28_011719 [Choristoneura fumiferana]|uniref:Uncharacterized protein n=1 Tax=Choristoneura fumiferana TaxID=7141 RepID=A0ACC0KML8_CHOFU|nr:hypothetical protein MSG28_011719 [Choristoneura fumiferana]